MSATKSNRPASAWPMTRGLGLLACDATARMTDVVEGMHLNIARRPLPFGRPATGRTTGITGLVYASIRFVTGGVRGALDGAMRVVESFAVAPESGSPAARENLVAALNGVVGDHLETSGNPLAIAMSFRHEGKTLGPDDLDAVPRARSGRVLVAIHGLCMNDLQWTREGHDHAARLAGELDAALVYLHYNSGRHISINGREFADRLEALLRDWPVAVTELTVLAHSMGGLVARSACHHGTEAGHGWLRSLKHIVFLGTPHRGAPLERRGHRLDRLIGISPYTASLARLGKLRSAGITDLRHGNLLDRDWQGIDRFAQHPVPAGVPLPDGVACFAAAATLGEYAGAPRDVLLGDGLVPLESALALPLPKAAEAVFCNTNHWDLLSSPAVYARLRDWLLDRETANTQRRKRHE